MFARLGSGCRAAATALALARAAASMLVKMDRSTTFRTGGADVPATTFASGHGHSSGWSLERSRRSRSAGEVRHVRRLPHAAWPGVRAS